MGKKSRFFLQAGGTKARVPISRLPGSRLVMIFSTVPLKSIFRVRDGRPMDITGIRPTTRWSCMWCFIISHVMEFSTHWKTRFRNWNWHHTSKPWNLRAKSKARRDWNGLSNCRDAAEFGSGKMIPYCSRICLVMPPNKGCRTRWDNFIRNGRIRNPKNCCFNWSSNHLGIQSMLQPSKN